MENSLQHALSFRGGKRSIKSYHVFWHLLVKLIVFIDINVHHVAFSRFSVVFFGYNIENSFCIVMRPKNFAFRWETWAKAIEICACFKLEKCQRVTKL